MIVVADSHVLKHTVTNGEDCSFETRRFRKMQCPPQGIEGGITGSEAKQLSSGDRCLQRGDLVCTRAEEEIDEIPFVWL